MAFVFGGPKARLSFMLFVSTAAAAIAGCGRATMTTLTPLDGGDKNESGADIAPHAAEPREAGIEAPRQEAGTDSGAGNLATPDEYWLHRVGTGPAQTRRVCARSQSDPVAKALCGPAAQTITGLTELHHALDLPPARRGSFDLALANSSSGLSFRTVSPLNPRVFAMTDLLEFVSPTSTISLDSATPPPGAVVTAFSRGEQQVELAGYDRASDTLKLYLLTFTQDCNRQGGCDAEHLLGEAVEREWRSWTLYEADDLVDTPLDCLPCHQPESPGPRRLLMRDTPAPWFHWFPAENDLRTCSRDSSLVGPDLRGVFGRAHPAGYGSQDAASLAARADGHNLHSMLSLFRGVPPVVEEEPFVMPSLEVVDEFLCEQANPTWSKYRQATLMQRGFPIPSYAFVSLDPVRAAPAIADYPAFLRQHAKEDPFTLMSGLLSDDHQRAIGAWADPTVDGEGILREMCIRCHDNRAPAGSVRARFQVQALTAASSAMALDRIMLPPDSPYLMPPRRAGALPAPELAKLRTFLQASSARP